MALLNDEIVQEVTQMLAELPNEVNLVVFTNEGDCEYCPQIVQLAQEVAAASDKLSTEIHKIEEAGDKAKELNVERTPAIAILGEKDYGLRFYGIPSGHEFSTLLHGIRKAGEGTSELDDETKSYLSGIDQPVHLQVFVTPTCPYCPRSAILAYEMAVVSDNVRADVIESIEFQDLAQQFNVMGVPLNVVNGQERIEGAAPPNMVVEAIKRVLA